MGLEISKPECSLNSRYFLGVEESEEILSVCAKHKLYWFFGLVAVITVGLIVLYIITYNNDNETAIKLPLFIVALPFALFFLYYLTVLPNSKRSFKKEFLEHKLSGMDKKEFLNYKAGSDRAELGFLGSATSASILASSNIMGPYLRADRSR